MVDVTLVEARQQRRRPREDSNGARSHAHPRITWRLCGHGERARHAESLCPGPLLQRAYIENVTINAQLPSQVVPKLLAKSRPVHK